MYNKKKRERGTFGIKSFGIKSFHLSLGIKPFDIMISWHKLKCTFLFMPCVHYSNYDALFQMTLCQTVTQKRVMFFDYFKIQCHTEYLQNV